MNKGLAECFLPHRGRHHGAPQTGGGVHLPRLLYCPGMRPLVAPIPVGLALCVLVGLGSAQSPRRLIDLRPEQRLDVVRVEHRLAVYNDHVFFAGVPSGTGGGTTGVELYRAHLGQNSLQLLRDIHPGPSGSWPFGFTSVLSGVFFVAADRDSGFELWFTDGNTTRLVKDIHPGLASSVVPADQVRGA